jgi:hypothetical protein
MMAKNFLAELPKARQNVEEVGVLTNSLRLGLSDM